MTWIELPIQEIMAHGERVLTTIGAEPDVATRVMTRLVESERDGHPSHGLLRLPEYVQAARAGEAVPSHRPTATVITPNVFVVSGQRAFGCLAADLVAETLLEGLRTHPMVAVGLRDSHHIGRLASIGRAVADEGGLVLGFCNYLGAGQKVARFGGGEGCLATNPLLFACPRPDGAALVVDMTTSAVSEGTVRAAMLRGQMVSPDWLVDELGAPVTDPARLYGPQPSAWLAPLGGRTLGYKGTALALMVEVLAAVLTGAGAVGPSPGLGGNGGLFIGLRPDLFGIDQSAFIHQVEAMLSHVQSPGSAIGDERAARLPGARPRGAERAPEPNDRLQLPRSLWDQILALPTAPETGAGHRGSRS
ncbi:MAG: Ldh family oxidoreductase [Deltaproteobacteria bacterium]|nr:Ldh family oxidoreductase [Deltaproteobacteria bacterium]